MKVYNDERVDRTIRSLVDENSSEIIGTIGLFRDYGFTLSTLYLKKLTKEIWELRARRFRLLFGMRGKDAIIVNIFYKKNPKDSKEGDEISN